MLDWKEQGNTVLIEGQSYPIRWRGDVIVAGGGTAGVTAAAAAGRKRVSVMVLERERFLGGLVSSGAGLTASGGFPGGVSIGGLMDELLAKLRFAGVDSADMRNAEPFGVCYYYEPEYYKFLAWDILWKSGVNVKLLTRCADVLTDGGKVCGVVTEGHEGRGVYLCKALIDATGNAFLAGKAGAEVLPRGDAPLLFPYVLADVESDVLFTYLERDPELADARKRAAAGFDDVGSDRIWLLRKGLRQKSVYVNAIRLYPNGAENVTNTETEARTKLHRQLLFYRGYVPGMEKAYLLRSSSSAMDSSPRRIKGIATLTEADWLDGKCLHDGVMRFCGPICRYGKDGDVLLPMRGRWAELPFGAMAPEGLTNVLVAGAAISADEGVAGAIGAAGMMAMGQAAGVAASRICNGTSAAEIDGRWLRSMMDELGCDIDGDKTRSYFGDSKETIHGLRMEGELA